MVFINELTEDGRDQTVDRERGIILKLDSSDPECGYKFNFHAFGRDLHFEALSRNRVHGQPALGEMRTFDVNWNIYRLWLPDELKEKQSEIKELIVEALNVRGYLTLWPEKTKSVKVEFSLFD